MPGDDERAAPGRSPPPPPPPGRFRAAAQPDTARDVSTSVSGSVSGSVSAVVAPTAVDAPIPLAVAASTRERIELARATIFAGGAPPPPTRGDVAAARISQHEPTKRQRSLTVGLAIPPPQRATRDLEAGDVVPGTRYRIVRRLGVGGMGIVFEAEHLDIERRAALKFVHSHLCDDPAVAKLFRDEARAASRVGSEHIVEIYDFAEMPDGRLMFAMELLEGRTLADELEGGPLDVARTIAILRQVCKGLAAAHAKGIVHRDIKPENIVLVQRRGRHDMVKILDFGISSILAGGKAAAHGKVGSLQFMAPEIILGVEITAGVDVYALGCTAYEMLAGEPAMPGKTPEEVFAAHLEHVPTPLIRVGGEAIPAALDRVVQRCLAKRASDRYASVEDLEAALCEAQIAARMTTSWDDLALPDVDPEVRERLMKGMPDPGTGALYVGAAHGRGRAVVLWLGAIAAACVVAFVLARLAEPEQPSVDPVAEHVNAARAAAARGWFVYPPADAPEEVTAYGYVVRLEQSKDPAGVEAAAALRDELAVTLVRMGDEYWDMEGGKPFASRYYTQALVFAPDDAHAAARTQESAEVVAALRQKADEQSFTAEELAAAEQMAVDQVIDEALVVSATAANKRRTELKPGREPPPTKAAAPAASLPPVVVPAPTPAPEKPAPSGPSKSGADQARELVKQGRDAAAAGRASEAEKLFEQATTADPRSAKAWIGRSDLAFDSGDYSGAARYAEKATKFGAGNGSYWIRLGDAYFKVPDHAKARVAYQKAFDLGHADAKWRLEKVGG